MPHRALPFFTFPLFTFYFLLSTFYFTYTVLTLTNSLMP
jgi:hypothetical protein